MPRYLIEILPGGILRLNAKRNRHIGNHQNGGLRRWCDRDHAGIHRTGTPGLRQTIPASATAITVVGNSARNMFFARSAIALATRAPALPVSSEVSRYEQYRQIQYEITAALGLCSDKEGIHRSAARLIGLNNWPGLRGILQVWAGFGHAMASD